MIDNLIFVVYDIIEVLYAFGKYNIVRNAKAVKIIESLYTIFISVP